MLLSQLREGELDMVVGRMAQAQNMDGLTFLQLYSEKVIPVVRPGHPLNRPDWTPKALAGYPLMLPPPGAVIYPMVRAYLHNNDLSDPDPAFENVSLAFGRNVVQRSDTVWFISQGVVLNELETGTLVALPLQDDLLGGPVGVSMRENTVMVPEFRALLRVLKNSVRSSVSAE
jgi:LysR family pca operon transcriptional activator